MSAPSARSAPFVWYELMTSDPEAASAFYGKVIGWGAKDAGLGEPYTLMLSGSTEVAGVMKTPPELEASGRKAGWTGYIGVDDVDAVAARILQAGGKLLRPAMEVAGVGRFAAVADPQGATFALFKPPAGSVPPAAGDAKPVGWHELHAQDWKSAFEFYVAQFGWGKGYTYDIGPMSTYQLFDIDGVSSGGIMNAPPSAPAPSWHYYFIVESISAATARVRAAGGVVASLPTEVPGDMWIVQCVDPQGASFAMVASRR